MNGSASNDPDGTITSYVWKNGATQIATKETTAVTLPVGVHTITLTVTDNDSGVNTDTTSIVITKSNVNITPIASAGINQNIVDTDGNDNELVTLNGSASNDPDGAITSYVWKNGTTQIATGETAIVTLPIGTHTITLTVTDDSGSFDKDNVSVIIRHSSVSVVAGGGSFPLEFALLIIPFALLHRRKTRTK